MFPQSALSIKRNSLRSDILFYRVFACMPISLLGSDLVLNSNYFAE